MSNFKINIEKKTPLVREHFIELGWTDVSDKYVAEGTFLFEKDNQWISFYPGNALYPIPFIKTTCKDPSKEDWTPWPEDYHSMLKCPTKEILEIITMIL